MNKNAWIKTSEGHLPPKESPESRFSVDVVIFADDRNGPNVDIGYYDFCIDKWRNSSNGFAKVTKFLIPDPDASEVKPA